VSARLVLASAAALAASAAVLWTGTDGLRAFTSEQARRLEIAAHPLPVPAARFEDQQAREFRLDEYRGAPVAIEFVYVRCRALCTVMGAGFERLQEELGRADDDLRLLSVSFDPERDTPEALAEYAQRYRADGARWRIARVADRAELERLLGAFGVVVLADRRGEFQHNAAIHLVDRDGRLARILDLDASAREIRASLAR
jgi:protein SCO1/2